MFASSTIDAAARTLGSINGAKLIYDSTRRRGAQDWNGYSSGSSNDDGEIGEDEESVANGGGLSLLLWKAAEQLLKM